MAEATSLPLTSFRPPETRRAAVLDAEAAVRLFRDVGDGIGLLVSDVVLPALSGPQLVERLKGLGAEFRVIFMSGYAEENVNRSAHFDSDAAFLEKPFDPTNLVSMVRAMLDDDDGGKALHGARPATS